MMTNILMACGIYMIIFALLNHTRNFISGITYKVIPLFAGFAIVLSAMDMYGWINIFK